MNDFVYWEKELTGMNRVRQEAAWLTISFELSDSKYIMPSTPCCTVSALTPSFSEGDQKMT